MSEQVLREFSAFEAAIQQPRVWLFKHSPTCPISQVARAEFDMFKVDHEGVSTLFVDVVNSRELAREIATATGIEHESPQALLFENGKVTWHASHLAITKAALTAAHAPRC